MDVKNRDAQKRVLIAQFGASCNGCGYDRSIRALHFHHTDASEKSDWSGQRGHAARAEILAHPERFRLLCANCHIEEHERLDAERGVSIKCVKCGVSFRTRQHLINNGRKRYCSRTCQHADRVRVAQEILRDRVFKYVRKSDDCWTWTGYMQRGNVGIVGITLPDGTRETRTARSMVYELETGLRLHGKLDVSCKSSACVNPGHCLVR